MKKFSMEWDGDPAPFCCPVCGHMVYGEHADDTYCSHILFASIEDFGVHYVREDIAKTHQDLFREDDEPEIVAEADIVAELCRRIKSRSAVCFTITTNGIACGPCSTTFSVGVDWEA